MTDSSPPPEPPNKLPVAPRRIVRSEADHPANAEPEGRDRPSVSQRVFDQRPDQRAPSTSAKPRGAKPDLRDLPPPRRDTPPNVWRADPPPRQRQDAPREAGNRDRREGPRREYGDAPRPDRPGERRATPPRPGRDGPPPQWGDAPRNDFRDDRRAPPRRPEADNRGAAPGNGPPRQDNEGPRPAFRRDDRRATGFPPGPPRERPADNQRPPQRPGPDDRPRPQHNRDADRPQGGYGGDRPRGPHDDRRPAYPSGANDRPRPQYNRDDDRRPQGSQGGDRPQGPRDDRRPAHPGGPNDRPRPQHDRDADRPRGSHGGDRQRPPARDDRGPDSRPATDPQAPQRPPFDPAAPRREDQRLSKILAERGVASRREADDWIDAGWVKVDGEMAVLGARVFPHQVIEIDPAAKTQQAHRVTILVHKPIGYVSGQAEDGYEPASVLVTEANHWPEDPSRERWHPGHARGIAPAGRLDIDSTGLLVLTQDGRIARHLIGEDSDVEKEYLVRVEWPHEGPFPENELERLRHGLWLDGRELRPAKVSWANEDQLRFVLREGRKRQIRRMCEAVGLGVTGLKRVRIGSVVLGKLPVGQWRYLREDERF